MRTRECRCARANFRPRTGARMRGAHERETRRIERVTSSTLHITCKLSGRRPDAETARRPSSGLEAASRQIRGAPPHLPECAQTYTSTTATHHARMLLRVSGRVAPGADLEAPSPAQGGGRCGARAARSRCPPPPRPRHARPPRWLTNYNRVPHDPHRKLKSCQGERHKGSRNMLCIHPPARQPSREGKSRAHVDDAP